MPTPLADRQFAVPKLHAASCRPAFCRTTVGRAESLYPRSRQAAQTRDHGQTMVTDIQLSMILGSQALCAVCFSDIRPLRCVQEYSFFPLRTNRRARCSIIRLKCSNQPLTDDELSARERKIGSLVESAREAIFDAINSDDTTKKERVKVFHCLKT